MLLVVGQVVRPHGLRGEVVVEVRTDEPDRRFAAGSALATDPAQHGPLIVLASRGHQGRRLVTFEGVEDRNAAEALRGLLLCVDSDTVAPPEDPDEFHDHQLVGLRAQTPAGEEIGEVVRIEHAPASDLLVLRRPDGRSALIPFVKAIVPEVDLIGGTVIVTPPGGLLDL